jgi:hypothetical protein
MVENFISCLVRLLSKRTGTSDASSRGTRERDDLGDGSGAVCQKTPGAMIGSSVGRFFGGSSDSSPEPLCTELMVYVKPKGKQCQQDQCGVSAGALQIEMCQRNPGIGVILKKRRPTLCGLGRGGLCGIESYFTNNSTIFTIFDCSAFVIFCLWYRRSTPSIISISSG